MKVVQNVPTIKKLRNFVTFNMIFALVTLVVVSCGNGTKEKEQVTSPLFWQAGFDQGKLETSRGSLDELLARGDLPYVEAHLNNRVNNKELSTTACDQFSKATELARSAFVKEYVLGYKDGLDSTTKGRELIAKLKDRIARQQEANKYARMQLQNLLTSKKADPKVMRFLQESLRSPVDEVAYAAIYVAQEFARIDPNSRSWLRPLMLDRAKSSSDFDADMWRRIAKSL